MKQVHWGPTECMVSAVGLGCMRMERLTPTEAAAYMEKALELGVNFFDHADIYGGGKCESIFGQAVSLAGIRREDIWVQSKCGIVPGVMYDFSREHILEAVDGILRRLNMEYLDSLLLHRPDALMEPEEVAEAFEILHSSGKVRFFGVSNHTPGQISLLKKYVKQPICANQLQFGLGHTSMLRSGMECNMLSDGAVSRDNGVLDACRLMDITIQAWSPFQYGMFQGTFLDNEKFPELNGKLRELAGEYGVTATGIASAWILRHPAQMQLMAGTMNPGRLEEICRGAEIRLSRRQWYELYLAAGNCMP